MFAFAIRDQGAVWDEAKFQTAVGALNATSRLAVPGGFRMFDDDTRFGPVLQAVARIRKLNPKVEVNVQVVIGRGSREDLVNALQAVVLRTD